MSTTPARKAVRIGRRYTRAHVIRRDTEAGTFEEINSPGIKQSERLVQLALLQPLDAPMHPADRLVLTAGLSAGLFIGLLAVLNLLPGASS